MNKVRWTLEPKCDRAAARQVPRNEADEVKLKLSFALGRLALRESSRVAGEREAIVCTRYKKASSGRKLPTESGEGECVQFSFFEAATSK